MSTIKGPKSSKKGPEQSHQHNIWCSLHSIYNIVAASLYISDLNLLESCLHYVGAIGGGVLGALVLGCLSVLILITIKRGIKLKGIEKIGYRTS